MIITQTKLKAMPIPFDTVPVGIPFSTGIDECWMKLQFRTQGVGTEHFYAVNLATGQFVMKTDFVRDYTIWNVYKDHELILR